MKHAHQQGIGDRRMVMRMATITLTILFVFAIEMAGAQESAPTLTPEQMVEQLKPKPMRSRSLRNLAVEVAPPSLSLLIQFDFNSARVRPESQESLDNLAQAMK